MILTIVLLAVIFTAMAFLVSPMPIYPGVKLVRYRQPWKANVDDDMPTIAECKRDRKRKRKQTEADDTPKPEPEEDEPDDELEDWRLWSEEAQAYQ